MQDKQDATPAQGAMASADQLLQPVGGESLAINHAMRLAAGHHGAGRMHEAELQLRSVLRQEPRHAEAWHLLGVLAWQSGQPQQALQFVSQAVAADGSVALFHSNLAEMLRQQGRLEDAIRHGRRAIGLDPRMASAFSNLGIAHYDFRDFEAARDCHQQALALQPHLLQSINNLGSIARAGKDLKTAADRYRQALTIQPDYLEALSNLGAVLVEDDRADEAVPFLEKALALQPDYPDALCNLGLVRLQQNLPDAAIVLLRRALERRPDYAEALVGMARALQKQDRLDEAANLLRACVGHHPANADAWSQLGNTLMEQGEAGQAEAAYRRALALDPTLTDVLTGLGNLRLEAGKMDEAERLLGAAIILDPGSIGARFHLVQTKKILPGDADLAALEAMAADPASRSAEKRISLHYALGKAYDDLNDYERAFPHFLEGARLKRATLSYDPAADEARSRRIAQLCDRDFIDRMAGTGDPSDTPVFVLGMPRSGTTLTEQIIASHPQVHGAGELRDLIEVIRQPMAGQAPQPYPANLRCATPIQVTQWGRDYAARLRRHHPTASRITDKMPVNYAALGLIPLMLPNAKIIHVRRNPVDTCLSCFTRLFNRHQDATYDLAELGRHYVNYARLMQHWRQVLAPDSFLEVQYEDIVTDMETQARRLIGWAGLEWDDACLAFHENQRRVRTASVAQVRQPIYSSSVERWRHYEKFLGPLLDALGEFAPPR